MSTDDQQAAPGEASADIEQPAVPRPRSGGRHAMRRKPVLQRLQMPVGRALALTAVPTALLMGGVSARAAFAADKTASTSTPDTTSTTGTSTAANCGTTTGGTGSTPTASAKSSASPSSSATPSSSASPSSAATTKTKSAAAATPSASASPNTSAGSTPTASASASSPSLLDILDPLNLLHSSTTTSSTATPTASASSSASNSSVVSGVTKAVSGVTSSVAGTGSTVGKTVTKAAGTVAGASSALGGTVSSAASTLSNPTKLVTSLASTAASAATGSQSCDISKVAAPMDLTPGEFPAVTWKLKSSQLKLYNTVFHGVVTVQTAAGPKRVLKFTAEAVDIGDLQMSAYQGANTTLHIDGGSGTTSTMRTMGSQEITMYVTSLTGTIAGIEGLPLPPILRVTLTPDTLPAWIYNIVGDLNLKLQLTLDNADIDQVGQVGGNLTIPGFHGYGVTS